MKLAVALSVVVFSCTLSMSAPAKADAQLAVSICEYVAKDNKGRLRKKLKEARVKLRNIYDGISCGGNSLLRHAMINGADKAGTFIVKKLPAKYLAGSGDFDWAQSNGHGGTATAAAIKSRAGL